MQRKIRFIGRIINDTRIQIKIDGTTVHNGILTKVLNRIDNGSRYSKRACAEWVTHEESAVHELEISVINGVFEFVGTDSNHMMLWCLNDLATPRSTGENNFIPAYSRKEADQLFYRDSNSNVKINNIIQPRNASNEFERIGHWSWMLNEGDVFTSTMTLSETFTESPIGSRPNEQWDSSLESYLIWRPDHFRDLGY